MTFSRKYVIISPLEVGKAMMNPYFEDRVKEKEFCDSVITILKDIKDHEKNLIGFYDDLGKFHAYKKAQKEYTKPKKAPEGIFSEDELNPDKDYFKKLSKHKYTNTVVVGEILWQHFKHVLPDDYIIETVFSQVSSYAVNMFGSESAAKNAKQLAIRENFFRIVNPHFHFDPEHSKPGQAKTIAINKPLLKLCHEEFEENFCKDKQLQKKTSLYLEKSKTCYTLSKDMFSFVDLEEVKKRSSAIHIGITPRTYIPKDLLTDDEIIAMLFENVEQLEEYSRKVDKINENCEEKILKQKFMPTLHKSEHEAVTKIGLRCTNSLVSLKKDPEPGHLFSQREMALNSIFPNGYKEFDVSSSIFRHAFKLNHENWLPNDMDLYQFMFGEEDFKEGERKLFKDNCVRFYHETTKAYYNHMKPALVDSIKELGEDKVKETILEMKRRMEFFTGKSIGSMILVHESCVYIDVTLALQEMGIKVAQIYDCFYYDDHGLDIDIEAIVKECADAYYKRFGNKGDFYGKED